MKTRMALWKEYRDDINNNVQLQVAVQNSNKRLNVLHERILEILPNYDEDFPIKIKNIQTKFKEVSSAPTYSLEEINDVISQINAINTSDSFYNALDKIDFSSHELDDVLNEIKEHIIKNERFAESESDGYNVTISNPKYKTFDEQETDKKKISVAIDGPSGSGKSTVARLLAERYNLNYINTGLVYRAIALNAYDKGISFEDEKAIVKSLESCNIELLRKEKVLLNGMEVTTQLRADIISQGASKVSVFLDVRKWAVDLQKSYGEAGGVVMDGRDTTFRIMPNATFKFYLDTTPEVRARRRQNQNKDLNFETDYKTILKEIKERDFRDKNRKTDPLHQTKDAIYIDATDMSIKQVIEKIESIIGGKNYE